MSHFATFTYPLNTSRRAIRVSPDGSVSLVVTGAHGFFWTYDTTIDAERAQQIVATVQSLCESVTDDGGDWAIGCGEDDAPPAVYNVDRVNLANEAAEFGDEMVATMEALLADCTEWSEPVAVVPSAAGPSFGGLALWALAFLAAAVLPFIMPVAFLISNGLRVPSPEVFGIAVRLLLVGAPLTALICSAVLGRKFSRAHGGQGNPLLPAALGVGVVYLAITLSPVAPFLSYFPLLLALLPVAAVLGARKSA